MTHDVMHISQSARSSKEGVDVAEVFSVPRICKEAAKAGMNCGPAYDVANGWDLTDSETQKRVMRDLKVLKPKLAVACPPCGMLTVMQNMNPNPGSNKWMREQAKAKIMLRFAMQVAKEQIDNGRLFMFEHPVGSKAWIDRSVMQIAKQVGVHIVSLDQRMVGLQDHESGKPHKKPTYIMTNSEHIATQLNIQCDGGA